MTSTVRHITFDANDPYTLAVFWSRVTGWPLHPATHPGDDECLVDAPAPIPGLLFIRVPEKKSAKSRMHLDLRPRIRRDEELARVLTLGAAVIEDHRQPDGRGWVWCEDPEGNAFCVERSAAEVAAWDAAHPQDAASGAPGGTGAPEGLGGVSAVSA